MNISVTARKMELTDPIRSYTEDKIGKLEKYMDGNFDGQVLLRVERRWMIAEAVLHGPNVDFAGKESSDDLYAAIDGLVDKLERQLRKYKTRKLSRRSRRTKEAVIGAEAIDSGSITILGAPEGSETSAIVKEKIITLDRLTPTEAISRMEVQGDSFWAFSDVDTNNLGIIYRREDGTYGLIQAED